MQPRITREISIRSSDVPRVIFLFSRNYLKKEFLYSPYSVPTTYNIFEYDTLSYEYRSKNFVTTLRCQTNLVNIYGNMALDTCRHLSRTNKTLEILLQTDFIDQ